jgi:hypothetical protein
MTLEMRLNAAPPCAGLKNEKWLALQDGNMATAMEVDSDCALLEEYDRLHLILIEIGVCCT